MDGYLLVDKPKGWTSFDVVAKVRSIIKAKTGQKIKIGHTGTLDPMATGLLILVLGKYTKRAAEFSKLNKVYEAELTLGQVSSAGDQEGEITPTPFMPHHSPARQSRASSDALGALRRPGLRSSLDVSSNTPPSGAQPVLASHPSTNGFSVHIPTKTDVEAVLNTFLGEINQMPPAHSAIKIDGQRAYKAARAGKTVKMEPRKVTIFSWKNVIYTYPKLKFTVHVSSGTYIRSLAVDIGEDLDTGAYLSALRRTRVGEFDIITAVKLIDLDTVIIKNNLLK